MRKAGNAQTCLKYIIGPYIKTYIAWSTYAKIRKNSASGGVATTLLIYLLREGLVDAVLVPRPEFRNGLVYGIWTILRNPNELAKYSGSLYAPVYGLSKVLSRALNRFKRIAITAIPCHAKVIKRIAELQRRSNDIFVIGLYCNNTPSEWATKYALKYFGIRVEDVEWVRFRGYGWPGYSVIKLKNRTIYISRNAFWDSGFGQYFYRLGCYLCTDPTNAFSDISLADPWTLPYEPIERLGDVTSVIVRNWRGLEVFEGAVRAGYVKAMEIDPVYAVQYTTLLKRSKRVLRNVRGEYVLPPGFTTMAHELVYSIGNFLARREGLWLLLKMFHKTIVPGIYFLASLLDHKVAKTRWGRIHERITRIQKLKASRYIDLASHQASP